MDLRLVQEGEKGILRTIAEAYWLELMPHADVVTDPVRREAYFASQFAFAGDSRRPQWAVEGDERVGFVSTSVDRAAHTAFVEDFYILPAVRRQGYGRAVVQALYAQLDVLGITQVDLSVRRDTPQALAFWEALGFRIAAYRLRQYRDPAAHQSIVGALSSDFAR
jgi:ribosomal protein S18 acetylase RimI-like enzyme